MAAAVVNRGGAGRGHCRGGHVNAVFALPCLPCFNLGWGVGIYDDKTTGTKTHAEIVSRGVHGINRGGVGGCAMHAVGGCRCFLTGSDW